MVFFLTITLLISCTGLILLLGLKRYELKSNRLILGGIRPRAGGIAHRGVLFIESVLPALFLRGVRNLIWGVRAMLHRALARAIVLFEHGLHILLVSVHDMTRPPESGGPASAFLQEVAEHKRKIQKRSSGKRAIFDDR